MHTNRHEWFSIRVVRRSPDHTLRNDQRSPVPHSENLETCRSKKRRDQETCAEREWLTQRRKDAKRENPLASFAPLRDAIVRWRKGCLLFIHPNAPTGSGSVCKERVFLSCHSEPPRRRIFREWEEILRYAQDDKMKLTHYPPTRDVDALPLRFYTSRRG
jgi:hypothetical protein